MKKSNLFIFAFLLMTISLSFGVLGQMVTCYTNADCGTDGLLGNIFCNQSGNPSIPNWFQWDTYRTWTCYDAGLETSYCDYADEITPIFECTGFCSMLDGVATCVDWTTPNISISYPVANGTYNFLSTMTYDYTYFQPYNNEVDNLTLFPCVNPSYCWYSLTNGTINSTQKPAFNLNFSDITYTKGQNNLTLSCWLIINSNSLACNDTQVNMTKSQTITFYYFPPEVQATSISPINDTDVSSLIVNYTANISCSMGCRNSTLYFKNSTGTIYSVFTDLTGINQTLLGTEVNLSSYASNGNYVWYYDIYDTTPITNLSEERTIIINITFPAVPVQDNLIKGSGDIYDFSKSSGAGLGLFLGYMALALPLFLIGLAVVGIFVAVGYALSSVIRKFIIKEK